MNKIIDLLAGKRQIHPDILGFALKEYMESGKDRKIRVYSPMFYSDYVRPSLYFRDPRMMPEIEKKAMDLCQGRVLDAGAGAGSHSLVLQERGLDVTSLDVSLLLCEIMRARGLKEVVCRDFFQYRGEGFDSLLMMMNGIGIAGTLGKVETLVKRLPEWLKKGGRLIFDSSDLSYLSEKKLSPAALDFGMPYIGEMTFRFGYRRFLGPWFNWIYVDYPTMEGIVSRQGFKIAKVCEGNNNHYLAVITI